MPRLIDADALKKEWSLGDKCEECPQNAWKCQFEQNLTQMDICQMIDEAPTVSGWVSVKERLPEDTKQKIVFHKRGVSFAYFSGNYWWSSIGGRHSLDTVTHWMPLPEPPKEDDA